jgi:pyruvate formate lyase activating enzyme
MTRNEAEGAQIVPLGRPTVGGSHARPVGQGTAGLEDVEYDHGGRLAAVRAGELGSVHSWELVTAVDGPGTRLTVFLAGCLLRCVYCHNPDTLEIRRGKSVTSDELLGRVNRYRGVFTATGGGLTLSGGEPMMQASFVRTLMRGAKAMDVHTALDTSGFLGASCTDEILDDIDLILLDVKSGLPDTYQRVTGQALAPTLAFGRRLAERGTEEVWVRFVLVPDWTDAVDNVEAVATYVASLGSVVTRVEVLPFHQMGADKWAELGMRYELEGVHPPTHQLVDRVRGQFRAHGLTTY